MLLISVGKFFNGMESNFYCQAKKISGSKILGEKNLDPKF